MGDFRGRYFVIQLISTFGACKVFLHMRQNSLLYYITTVLRLALYPFTLIYGALVWLRNRLYDVKFFNSVGFSLPVISVGNLSTGGTGKTPHVEYLIMLLQYQYRVAT